MACAVGVRHRLAVAADRRRGGRGGRRAVAAGVRCRRGAADRRRGGTGGRRAVAAGVRCRRGAADRRRGGRGGRRAVAAGVRCRRAAVDRRRGGRGGRRAVAAGVRCRRAAVDRRRGGRGGRRAVAAGVRCRRAAVDRRRGGRGGRRAVAAGVRCRRGRSIAGGAEGAVAGRSRRASAVGARWSIAGGAEGAVAGRSRRASAVSARVADRRRGGTGGCRSAGRCARPGSDDVCGGGPSPVPLGGRPSAGRSRRASARLRIASLKRFHLSFFASMYFCRGSSCVPPGRQVRARPRAASRSCCKASRASSGELHSRPRWNHLSVASGRVRRSWTSVGCSSAASRARNAVGSSPMTMVQ